MQVFKKDLVATYAEIAGITKVEADRRITTILELISSYLEEGYDVKLSNFFNFFVKERAAKEGINPITKEPMTIPATRTVHVKMTKSLKERIQGKR